MRTILPIPLEYGGARYVAAEYRPPSAGVLADTRVMTDQGSQFGAFHVLLQGVVDALESDGGELLEDKGQVRAACKYFPYRSAELVVMYALAMLAEDDGIEGYYSCPRCGQQAVCSKTLDSDGELLSDDRDLLSDLEVTRCEDGVVERIELAEPVEIKITSTQGQASEMVTSLTLHHPTLKDCMAAERRSSGADQIRRQLAIYVEATDAMNDDEVDQRWRNNVGKPIFEGLRSGRDMVAFTRMVQKYGLQSGVDKNCTRCGKVWRETVDVSSFFASALRVM